MTVPERRIKVAIGDQFLDAFAKIPKKEQGKVHEFVIKFRSNPMSPGIHLEKIKNVRDPNLRSVRIDQAYRGIVLQPPMGNLFVLLWVAHHDDAYSWAENKVYTINPDTGGLQVVSVAEAAPPKEEVEPGKPGLFDDIRDRELKKLGVPELLLPSVRALKDKDELLEQDYPEEVLYALYLLAEGEAYETVLWEVDKEREPEHVDTEDFVTALEHGDSQSRFFVVDDELDLQRMLAAPLEKWRVFLHPTQRKLVRSRWKGPARILGGAGTGKTVVAIHRAKFLAEQVYTDKDDRILFTTFTRNLAEDITSNLKTICSDETLKRIDVVNLDRWVSDFLRKNGYSHDIDYGARTDALWQDALNMKPLDLQLSDAFFREEWNQVIQPQEVRDVRDYFSATRVGRGVRLTRKDRQKVWRVFEAYRAALNERGLKERDDALCDARMLLEQKGDVLPYRAVIVDEAQDMGDQAFKLIRQIAPKGPGHEGDVFIVGDAHQRIYRYKVTLSRCGLNIRGRARKLRVNYRTTEENRRWAVNLLRGLRVDDLDGGTDDHKAYRALMHGEIPEIRSCASFADEVKEIANHINDLENQGVPLSSICLVARTKTLVGQYRDAMKERGFQPYQIVRSQPEDTQEPGLRLATMHRVKGLEFEHVIIGSVNRGVIPADWALREATDATSRADLEQMERALLYVAVTRAKKSVLLTTYGVISPFLEQD